MLHKNLRAHRTLYNLHYVSRGRQYSLEFEIHYLNDQGQ